MMQLILDSKLRQNVLAMYLAQFANIVIPLLTMPYLARVLGAEAFGELTFAQALAMYFVLLTDWGFALSAPQQIVMAGESKHAIAGIFSEVFSAKIVLLVCSAVLLLLSLTILPDSPDRWRLYCAAWLICVGNVMTLGWALQARERLDLLALASLLGKFIALPFIFVTVKTPSDAWMAALLTSASTLVAGAITWVFVSRMLPLRSNGFSLRGAVTQLKRSADIFVSTAAISLYTFGSTVALGILAGTREVAVFSSADKVRGVVQSFVGPVNQALFPRANRSAMHSPHAAKTFLRHALALQLVLTGGMSLFLFCGASRLIPLLFGGEFVQAVPVLKVLAALPVIVGASNVFGIQGMLPLGMKKEFSRILVLVALGSVIFLIPAALRYGAIGVAWVTVLAECFVTAAMAVALYKAFSRAPAES